MPFKTLLTMLSFGTMAALLPVCIVVLYKRPAQWHTVLTIYLGFLVGFIDLNCDEVSLPVLLLLAFGFFLGFARQDKAWLHAILLAVWVPISSVIHLCLQPGEARWLQEGLGSCIAFIPAFIGIYIGVAVGRSTNQDATHVASLK